MRTVITFLTISILGTGLIAAPHNSLRIPGTISFDTTYGTIEEDEIQNAYNSIMACDCYFVALPPPSGSLKNGMARGIERVLMLF